MIRSCAAALLRANCKIGAPKPYHGVLSINRSIHQQEKQDVQFPYLIQDRVYEKVRTQNFAPIPIAKCSKKEDALNAVEFEKRNNLSYDGIPYSELPIVLIQARWNNTLIETKYRKEVFSYVSCNREGFKNAKKKTDHASEMTGKAGAQKALIAGCHKHVRVVLRGIGPGRKAAIKGLTLGGMNVVSITDTTPITNNGLPQRPRKIRRL
nr:28S ribosomal protein S11, mitochondrial isoform X2 [Ciona intestinalis]|eukprot:XP_009862134.1 28S ribosomal protein S11, mitochondrial isoform X2 [Ciona intestinalis]